MARFRKKPVVIEAVQWHGSIIGITNGKTRFDGEALDTPHWLPAVSYIHQEGDFYTDPNVGEIHRHGDVLYIGTLEGPMRCEVGDWIIRGIKGELYPCKPDIFEGSYDRAEE